MDTCIERIVISRILMLCGCFYRRKEAYHNRQQALKQYGESAPPGKHDVVNIYFDSEM